jgi:thioester reductase-like protein
MAVLVRPTATQSAWERVDKSLAHWEKRTGRALPRPIVLEGDVCRPDLNLGAPELHWIAHHCHAIVHAAASLTFVGSDPQREPWLTNVEGTRRVLDLCRRCEIRQFHYISTAYVCGLREGLILETELDLGQPMSNDYERSKLEAEKLVHRAALPQPATVYRPSIIVGDSQTGYTSGFHGFYAMVKLAHTLASQVSLRSTTARKVFRALNLRGHERKDYVPVDWVSAVLTHLLGCPEHHGRTYHLTATESTPVTLWSQVIQDAVETYSPLANPADVTRRDARWFGDMFRQQSEVYRSYWRDDPPFDRTHTKVAAGHLPCPAMDYDRLLRMARFAICTNFGKRPPAPQCDPESLQPVTTIEDA